jgi:hypothetical protein
LNSWRRSRGWKTTLLHQRMIVENGRFLRVAKYG